MISPPRFRTGTTRRTRHALSILATAALLLVAVQSNAGAATPAVRVSTASARTAAVDSARYVPVGWPDYSTTGASGTLTPLSGRTITRDGTVIRNRLITGQVTIKADNVTLSNVYVRSNGFYGILTYGQNTLIEHTTVQGTAPNTLAGIAATENGNFVARHVEVKGSEDGVRLTSHSILADSLVHQLAGSSSSHFDSVTADGYVAWQIRHNTILNQKDLVAAVWTGDSRYGPSSGVLADNYLAGGGFTIYAGTGVGRGIRILRNVFSTRFYPRSGYWGIVYDWRPAGNTWTGNTWIDGPKRGTAVLP